MKRYTLIVTMALLAALFGNVARADLMCPGNPSGPAAISCAFFTSGNSHEWDFDYSGPTLTLSEVITSISPDDMVISGQTDSASVFTVVKTIENDSGADWTQYTITMAAMVPPTFVDGSATAADGMLQTVEYPHPSAIVFSGDDPVLNGQTLTLQFDVHVPTCGPFQFAMTQQPVPEPTTIALLSLGSLVLYKRRR